jgi:hypothetical protein
MWRRTFIRLAFVLMVLTAGILVFAAADNKLAQQRKECSANTEKCESQDENSHGDFIIWESVSRTILSAVMY